MQTVTQHKAFVILLALVTVAFFLLIKPHYGAIFWAVILAILFQPMNNAFFRWFKGRSNLAALTSVTVCIFIVIIPTSLIIGALVREGASVYTHLRSGDIDFNGYLMRIQNAIPPRVIQFINHYRLGNLSELREHLSSGAAQGSQMLASSIFSFGQNTLEFSVGLGIMLYLLFYLYRDGQKLGNQILAAIPLSEDYTNQLVSKFTAVVRATVKGNVIIAIVQGIIGGVTFWLLGINAALLCGVMMGFMSLLPAIGAAVVWIPVAIYLLVVGDYISGGILIFVGVCIIGMVDNVLRPPLVGKETKLPDYMVLISTIGGLSMFGINGFVVGPLIAALFIAAWTLFAEEQSEFRRRNAQRTSHNKMNASTDTHTETTDNKFQKNPTK